MDCGPMQPVWHTGICEMLVCELWVKGSNFLGKIVPNILGLPVRTAEASHVALFSKKTVRNFHDVSLVVRRGTASVLGFVGCSERCILPKCIFFFLAHAGRSSKLYTQNRASWENGTFRGRQDGSFGFSHRTLCSNPRWHRYQRYNYLHAFIVLRFSSLAFSMFFDVESRVISALLMITLFSLYFILFLIEVLRILVYF